MDITPVPPRRKPSRRTVLLGGAVAALGVAAVPVALAWPEPDPPVPPPSPRVVGSRRVELFRQDSRAMAFSADGRMLATGSSTWVGDSGDSVARVQLWDVATGASLGEFDEVAMVDGLAFNPDGQYLASSEDMLCLRDVATGGLLAELGDWAGAMAFSPDGSILAAGGPDGVGVYDMATRKHVTTLAAESVPGLAFSADGTRLAVADRRDDVVRVWDTSTWQQVVEWPEPKPRSVTFIGESSLLALGRATRESTQDVVVLRDPTTGEETARIGFEWPLVGIGLSRDGSVLAVSGDQGVQLWDLPNARLLNRLANGGFGDVLWSPSDTTIAAVVPSLPDEPAGVYLWDLTWSP